MKKNLFILIILFLIFYIGTYQYKNSIYRKYEEVRRTFRFGQHKDFILRAYYCDYKRFPKSEQELRDFVVKKGISIENGYAHYISQYKFHIKDSHDTIFIYDEGLNFRDDHLSKNIRDEDVNIFNYLFKEGDVLLFYSLKNKIKKKCSIINKKTKVFEGEDLFTVDTINGSIIFKTKTHLPAPSAHE